ncbi:RNA-binding domain-containing protein [Thelephora ganbajun]|uniref:RNA-binding domain-containing protein n=1 Tax=Thelephora ganbajun TaxID=370292 RepID=A0ACB6ZT10_THEGA|nr:RNA-binding domain-containing protein [Thelephora ganbajun]
MLGKRKYRDGAGEATGTPIHKILTEVAHLNFQDSRSSTLFVSNLPYTATSTDLKTLFSDIAPVRNAFVVLEHDTGISKGVGYVSFAIKEDVQLALEKISSEGLTIDGRSVRAQLAETRRKDKDSVSTSGKNVGQEAKPTKTGKSKGIVSTSKDPLAIRTVVLSGLPSSIDAKVLWKKIRKQEGAEKVDWPANLQTGEEDPTQAYALFSDLKTAQDAVKKLHAHIFKGSIISATLKKRIDNSQKPAASTSTHGSSSSSPTKSQSKPQLAPSRANRLIVRNLPFDIKEEDIKATFLPCGPIHSIDIPKTEDGRAKGFAFVWMMSKGDAQRALERCNGMKIRAGVAEQLVQAKQKKKKQVRIEEKISKEKARKDQEKAEEEVAGVERVIAVDWALSKDRWEEAKVKMEVDEDAEMGESDSDSGESNESEGDSGSGSGSGEEDAIDSKEILGDNSDEEGEEDESGKPLKPQLPAPEAGTTLFVRNIPFEATEDELRVLFRTFGPLRYARITMDHETGRTRGTGFACFWNVEDADRAIEKSDLLRLETTGSTSTAKPNPFKLPSILTPDPSSSLAQSLVLHGRTLDVVRAVTRNEATKLKEEGERKRERVDKRNVYLLREGVIMANSPAADSLPEEELEKRINSFNARRNLLRTNPSLYVSKTRLSVRQIPVDVTEYMLKRLANYAIREFEEEAARGERELLDPGEIEEEEVVDKKGRKSGQKVKQAKIVRESSKVDGLTGKGRSKGYGFLELYKHEDALRVLRWANNNRAVGDLWERWWKTEVEEMIKKENGNGEEGATRLKKLKEEAKREESRWRATKKALIVEFSIENVQVTERRKSRQITIPRSDTDKQRSMVKEKRDDSSEMSRRPKKRQRTRETTSGEGPSKRGPSLGSPISQGRKQRKAPKA